jgi:Mg2+ and Co2+ transporter CorA
MLYDSFLTTKHYDIVQKQMENIVNQGKWFVKMLKKIKDEDYIIEETLYQKEVMKMTSI